MLEMVVLQAAVLQLKANPRGAFEGVVVEAKLERGRGPVATVLVQEGTLKIGDAVVVGQAFGRIKAMADYLGERIEEAGPSTPVEIVGLSETPLAGDRVEVEEDERSAREIAERRASEARGPASARYTPAHLTSGEGYGNEERDVEDVWRGRDTDNRPSGSGANSDGYREIY